MTARRPPGASTANAPSRAQQAVQLAVDLDADGLEGPFGGVTTGATSRCGDRVSHDVRELLGVLERSGVDDRPGDPAGELVLAVGPDDA